VLTRLHRHRGAREALVFLVFCAFTVLLTWPYVSHLRDAVADTGDPYFVSWVLWWDYHQTFTDPLNLFHANLFFPLRYTLAFTEHSYGVALPFFPLYAFGFRPLTVHAVALFFAFPSTGYAAFRLGRTLTGSAGAGWVTGIAFAFVPLRFTMLPHLHYLFAMWIPLVFEALVLFARDRSWKRAIWFGVAFFMSGLTCVTWFVFSLVPLAAAALILLTSYGIWRDPLFWRRGAVAVAGAGVALLPFMWPYFAVTKLYHFERSIEEVKDGSARAVHWLAVEGRNRFWRGLGDNLPGGARFRLFPGLLPLLLALAACLFAIVPAGPTAKNFRSGRGDAFWVGLVLAIIGFFYSLGWNSFFYRVLYDLLPIFRSIRITARGAMFAYLGLAVLAGLGAKALAEFLSRRSPRLYPAPTFGLLASLLLFELNTSPLEIVRGDVDPDALTLRLKETTMRGGVVFLPATASLSHRRTLRAADHMKPLITGNTSFNSSYQGRIEVDTGFGVIRDELMRLLEEIPTSYLVIETEAVAPERRVDYENFLARAVTSGRLRYINRFDGRDDLYAVVKTEPESKAEAPLPFKVETRDWATLIQEDPVNLLGEFRSWSQAVCRLHVASYAAMPRYAEVVSDVMAIGRGVTVSTLDDQTPRLEENLRHFATQWVERPQFKALYDAMNDESFIDAVAANAGLRLPQAERSDLLQKIHSRVVTRAETLITLVMNTTFREAHAKRSLVLLHYFGYLRRNPEDPPDGSLNGFNFWLKEIETTGEVQRLSRAFTASIEYGARKKK
jgi:hypothetical protein